MIRISTSMIFAQGVFNMQNATSALLKTQNQISAGRRLLTPADDPVAAARSLEVSQSQAITDQYARNTDSATASLGLSDNALAGVTTLIQNVKTLAVNAGDGALTQSDLSSIATALRSNYQQLLALSNSTDGNGQYLFSGFQGSTQPFAELSPGVVAYQGDQGQRLVQISASRQVQSSDAGSDIFQLIKTGNRTFTTTAVAGNTGTGVVSPGTVTNAVAWNAAGNPKDFTVKFFVDNTVSPPVTTYDVVDNTTGNSLLTGGASGAGPYLRTYTDAGTITLATQSPPDTNPTPFDYGATLSVSGQPATGDSFTVKTSTNQDIFTTLNDLITAVDNAQRTATGAADLSNALNTAQSNLNNSLDNILRVRASIGTRLNEVDAAKSSANDLSDQYASTLSGLRDLDYAKSISDLAQQQITLQAAQQSFAKVNGLSLFNFLG
jgi:flagellar hook-associated protein 3 FlgL